MLWHFLQVKKPTFLPDFCYSSNAQSDLLSSKFAFNIFSISYFFTSLAKALGSKVTKSHGVKSPSINLNLNLGFLGSLRLNTSDLALSEYPFLSL